MADEQILNTSEVNPVDFFVEKKISFSILLYKLLCGAIVTVIALRLNDVLKSVIETITVKMKTSNKISQSLIDLGTVLVFVVIFSIIVRTLLHGKID